MLPLAVRYASFQRGFKLFITLQACLAANRCNIGFECFLEDLPIVFCAKLCNELFRNLNFLGSGNALVAARYPVWPTHTRNTLLNAIVSLQKSCVCTRVTLYDVLPCFPYNFYGVYVDFT
uniref:Putative secreted protein n=1 Tax=Rhipicephalus microplus TaxID=6941 RepID=A0A6G5A3H2_RHIMP